MKQYKTFETERLYLRPSSVDDAAFMLELLNSPKWIEHIGDRNVHTLENAKEYIETKILPQLVRLGFSNYTIIRKSDGSKIGGCGLYDREGLDGIDLGFALLPQYEKQGYGYESSSAILNAGIVDFGIKEVRAITTKQNVSSQKLLEKLGMIFIKIIRIEGDPEDLMLYEYQME